MGGGGGNGGPTYQVPQQSDPAKVSADQEAAAAEAAAKSKHDAAVLNNQHGMFSLFTDGYTGQPSAGSVTGMQKQQTLGGTA